MDGTGDLFATFVAALPAAAEATVVRYPADRVLGYAGLLPLVRAALPPREPFALLAESFSGPLAIRIAAEPPPNLRALVLVATFAKFLLPAPLRWLAGAAHPTLFGVRPPAAAVRALLAGRDAAPALVEAVVAAGRVARPGVMSRRLREVLEVDAEASVPSIRVPVLYLAGSRDRLVGRRTLARLRRLLPGIESVTLDAPHLVLQTRPAEAAREVLSFLRRVSVLGS